MRIAGVLLLVGSLVLGLVGKMIGGGLGAAAVFSIAAFCAASGGFLFVLHDRRKAQVQNGSLSLGLDTKAKEHPPKG